VKLAKPVGKHAVAIRDSTARLNIWTGSVSSGKTIDSLLRWCYFMATAPPGDVLMVGKTERSLKRNCLDPLKELVGPGFSVSSGSGEATLFKRRIYLAGANDQRSEEKIRGLSIVGTYGDEVTTWKEDFFRMLDTRLRLPGAMGFFTTNPDGPQHWLKRTFLAREGEIDLRSFHFTIDDNPNLDARYVTAIKKDFVGLWFRRFILGEWVQAEGAIYDMWDQDRFVVKECPPFERTWLGIDYGTSNAFVALLFGLAEDGKIYIAREYRWDGRAKHKQKTDSEYSGEIREWLAALHKTGIPMPDWIWVDPSAASFLQQLWRDGLHGVRPANNDVADGLRVTARTLAQDRMRIHESCEGLIVELPGYGWDALAQARGEDKPLKVNDHGPDALRYGTLSSEWIWRRHPLAA
jgi:PBSX family phage terminase large subunit